MAFISPEETLKSLSLNEGIHVADLGAGAGAYAIPAGRLVGSSGRVYAVDVNKELLENVKRGAMESHAGNVEIIWGDIESPKGTKLADRSVDRVIISNTLFLAEDRVGLAKEASRILRPGGLALLIDWSSSHGGLGPKDSQVVSKDAASKLFLNNGFAPVRDVSAGDYHWGLLLRKL